jgi:hypothetical protein
MYLTPKMLFDTSSTSRRSDNPHTYKRAWPQTMLKRTWYRPFRAVYDDHPLGGVLGRASTPTNAVLVMRNAGMAARKAKLARTAHQHLRPGNPGQPGQLDMIKRRRSGWVPAP